MVANYFLGAVILMLNTDIAFGTEVCLCPTDIFRFLPDCCRSTTHDLYTGSGSSDVGVCVGLIISSGFVSFVCLAVWVIVTRRRQLPAPQRSLDRRSPVLPNMENLTSNPEMNLNVPRTGTYAYGEYSQESVIGGWPPPYTLASLCQPVTPIAPPPYTMGSHSEHVVLVAPPPYTPASPSVPPPPYSEYI